MDWFKDVLIIRKFAGVVFIDFKLVQHEELGDALNPDLCSGF